MKIIADENMAALAALFAPHGEVVTVAGRTLSKADVANADVLLVRSVTEVNASLLEGTSIRFVGSATIGTDHVDVEYLKSRGIVFAHAPGCNAEAVVDYVVATLFHVEEESWFNKTIAIVGCGNVGSRLYRRLAQLGVNCLCYDPFLSPDQQDDLCEIQDLQQADILCLHTPLTRNGPYPTYHLFDRPFMKELKPGALIINGGRGAVIDNTALLHLVESGHVRAVLDVWEGEPEINTELLNRVEQGTPHIAGYSLEGRLRGSLMVYEAFCRWLSVSPVVSGLQDLLRLSGYDESITLTAPRIQGGQYQTLRILVKNAYDPAKDFVQLLNVCANPQNLSSAFDCLRKEYPLRREFAYQQFEGVEDQGLRSRLNVIGFALK